MYNEGTSITKQLEIFCQKWADANIAEIEKKIKSGEVIPDGFKNKNRYYQGCKGEDIFHKILTEREIKHHWTLPSRPFGTSDKGIDFILNEIIIDVKAIPENGKMFIVNVAELERATQIADYFVGITWQRDWGYFVCWFSRDEVLRMLTTSENKYLKPKFTDENGKEHPAYYVFLNELGMFNQSFAEFLNHLAPGMALNCASDGQVEPSAVNQPS